MSDGITLYCPQCGELSALKKEKDFLHVKLNQSKVKKWYETILPVYTCQKCGKKNVIEGVSK